MARGSAAAEAGLRGASREVVLGNYRIPWGGDLIVAIDGVEIADRNALQQALALKLAGDTVTLELIRGSDRIEAVLTLRGRGLGIRL